MLAALLGLFGPIAAIGKEIAAAQTAKAVAATDKERIAADERINRLNAMRDVLIAEQGSWFTRWVRPMFALPFVIYNAKLVLWDKVLALGVTDPLSTELAWIQSTVIGFYFLGVTVETVAANLRKK